MLVVPGIAHSNRPHQRGIAVRQTLLQRSGQLQVLPPLRMFQTAAVRADHQAHLGRVHPGHIADHLVHTAVIACNGVPVYIQNKGDAGVLLHIRLHRLQRPVVGPAVLRVIVERGIVEHSQSGVLQSLGQLVPHPHHVVRAICRPTLPAGDVLLPRRHGICLAAVGVDNQHLGSLLLGEMRCKAPVKDGCVQTVVAAVVDVHVSRHHIAVRRGRRQRLCSHAVVGKEQGRLRLSRLLRNRRGGGRRLLRCIRPVGPNLLLRLLRAPQLQHRLLPGQQRGALPNSQRHRDRQRHFGLHIPQLAAQQAQRQVAPLSQGLPGAAGGGAGGGSGHQVQHRSRQ